MRKTMGAATQWLLCGGAHWSHFDRRNTMAAVWRRTLIAAPQWLLCGGAQGTPLAAKRISKINTSLLKRFR